MRFTRDSKLAEFVEAPVFKELTPMELSIYLAIFAVAAKTKEKRFEVRNRDIAHSHVSVRAGLARLEELGLIRVFRGVGPTGIAMRAMELR